jgi:hypothetical protein
MQNLCAVRGESQDQDVQNMKCWGKLVCLFVWVGGLVGGWHSLSRVLLLITEVVLHIICRPLAASGRN